MFRPVYHQSIHFIFVLLSMLVIGGAGCKYDSKEYPTWHIYRGDASATQFSALKQIDTTNVHLLKPVWIFHTGDSGSRTTIECNPIIIGDMMYITSPRLHLIALNAVSGQEIWRFKPMGQEGSSGINRGVTYWPDQKEEQIFYSAGHYLYAVHARTGAQIQEFGHQGRIDLRADLDRDTTTISISLTSPAILYDSILIIGSATGEGYDASPGHIRAYHARTGALKWTFHTIPYPGEYGYSTWNWIKNENYGGTNNWGGLSLDEKKGIVYVATGSPTYDFYGGNRKGDNLFANCVIALDAHNGQRIWHYQTVKHDIWDYDLPCAPTLATIPWSGGMRDILIQPTKMGELILLDRNTGIPLLKPDELSVPPSDIPGEQASKTQSFNQGITLVKQGWDTSLVTDISDSAKAYVLAQSRKYKFYGMYTPPSEIGTITQPGTRGGMGWGGISYDPKNNIVYTTCNDFPMLFQLEKVGNKGGRTNDYHEGERTYLLNCSNCHGGDRKGTVGIPGLLQLQKKNNAIETRKIITQGKGLMPAHTQFSNQVLDQLIHYLYNDHVEVKSRSEGVDTTLDKYVLKGFKIFTDKEGYPGSKPPWGTLNAVDIGSGQTKWSVPLGYYPKLKARGISNTGTQNFGGCVATSGGLVFVGSTADELFRAYHMDSGRELWSYQLPAGGYATPSVYSVHGKQYIVIAAGGGNRNATPSNDIYITFALPD